VLLALGAGTAASVLAGTALTGAKLQIETLAKRPDNNEPWVASHQALPDTAIGVDGRFTLVLPALNPGTDPLMTLRMGCEAAARSGISLPNVPDGAPSWVKAAYAKAKQKLEDALRNCGARFPTPPGSANFPGQTLTVEIKNLFTLR
jgi:hypothetical protein